MPLTRIDPAAKLARVEPGIVLDRLRDAAEAASPHLRARPRHPLPLHPRRHDRQQQLRRARPAGRQSRRQRGIARHRSLRRHAHDRRPHHAGRARRAHPRRRPRRPDLRRPQPIRDTYAALIREKVSPHSAPRLRLQPRRAAARKQLQRGPRAGRL